MSIRKTFSIALLALLVALPVFAQEVTPNAPTQTANVVTATPPPTEEVTAEVTPVVTPAPEPVQKPFDITPFLPFIFGIIGIIVIAAFSVVGLQAVLLFRSQPVLWAIAKPLGQTGVDKFTKWTKEDDQAWNDVIGEEFAKRWAEFEGKVDAKVDSKVGAEVQKQLPDAVSIEVAAQSVKG